MPKAATSKKKVTKAKKPAAKKAVAKKPAAKKKVAKKPVAKKAPAKKAPAKKKLAKAKKPAAKRKAPAKKVAAKAPQKDLIVMQLTSKEVDLAPPVPKMPTLPEPPRPVQGGVCRACQVLPAAAMELVIVLTCLVFSLSAVLLTSVQTIEQQQLIIQAQQDRHEYFVKR